MQYILHCTYPAYCTYVHIYTDRQTYCTYVHTCHTVILYIHMESISTSLSLSLSLSLSFSLSIHICIHTYINIYIYMNIYGCLSFVYLPFVMWCRCSLSWKQLHDIGHLAKVATLTIACMPHHCEAWRGKEWQAMAWRAMSCMECHGMACQGIGWHAIAWHGMARQDRVCNPLITIIWPSIII